MRSSNIYLDGSRKFKKFRPSNTDQIKIIRRHYLFISSLIFLSTQELRRFLLKSMNKINFRKRLQLANKSFQTNSIANFNNFNYFSINFMFISGKLLKKTLLLQIRFLFPVDIIFGSNADKLHFYFYFWLQFKVFDKLWKTFKPNCQTWEVTTSD